MAGVDATRFWQLTPAELCIETEVWGKCQEMADYRLGLLCAVMAEPYRDAKKHPQPFTPQDFMPDWVGEKTRPTLKQDWREQIRIVERLNEAFGGDDLRR